MSRTIRRKKDRIGEKFYAEYWINDDWYKRKLRKEHFGLTDDEIVQKLKSKFHAQNSRGRFNAPRRFRKMINKSKDMKNKTILYNAIFREQEFVPILYKKDANWNYF